MKRDKMRVLYRVADTGILQAGGTGVVASLWLQVAPSPSWHTVVPVNIKNIFKKRTKPTKITFYKIQIYDLF